MIQIIKIGGNDMGAPVYLNGIARYVARLIDEQDHTPVIVHGGGIMIAALQDRLKLPIVKVEGLRVTDYDGLVATEMVLSGRANKQVVKAMLAAGVDALGMSGIDGELLRCRKLVHPTADLGFVGQIVSVRAELLERLFTIGLVPVVSPVSLGLDGLSYNVNADEAAAAIASALAADRLDFVSNVPGVLQDGQLLPRLTTDEANQLIVEGVVSGGMIPKVRAALETIANGVGQARIVDLDGLTTDGGTVFHRD